MNSEQQTNGSVDSLCLESVPYMEKVGALKKFIAYTPRSAMITDPEGKSVFGKYVEVLIDTKQQCDIFVSEVIKIQYALQLIVTIVNSIGPELKDILMDDKRKLHPSFFEKTITQLKSNWRYKKKLNSSSEKMQELKLQDRQIVSMVLTNNLSLMCGMSSADFKKELAKIDQEFEQDASKLKAEYDKQCESLKGYINGFQSKLANTGSSSGCSKFHFIFALDESGSMSSNWTSVVACVQSFVEKRKLHNSSDYLTVILFDDKARVVWTKRPLSDPLVIPSMRSGGTNFDIASEEVAEAMALTPKDTTPVVFFLTDGSGSHEGALKRLTELRGKFAAQKFMFFAIAFGSGADTATLKKMILAANGSETFQTGKLSFKYLHLANHSSELDSVFTQLSSIVDTERANMLETQKVLKDQIDGELQHFNIRIKAIESMRDNKKKNLENLRDSSASMIVKASESEKNAMKTFEPKEEAISKRKEDVIQRLTKYEKDLTDTKLQIAKIIPTLDSLSNEKKILTIDMTLEINSADEILKRNNKARMAAFQQTGFANDSEFSEFYKMKEDSDKIYDSFLLMVESTSKFIESLVFQISTIINNINGKHVASTIYLFKEIRDKWERENEVLLPPGLLEALKVMCKNYNEDIFDEEFNDFFKELDIIEINVINLITSEDVNKVIEELKEEIIERQTFKPRIKTLEKEMTDMDTDYQKRIKGLVDSKEGKKGDEKDEIIEQIEKLKEEKTEKKEKLKEAIDEIKQKERIFSRLTPKCLRLIYSVLAPIATSVLNPYQKKTLLNTIESSMAPGGLLQITAIYNKTTQNLISL